MSEKTVQNAVSDQGLFATHPAVFIHINRLQKGLVLI